MDRPDDGAQVRRARTVLAFADGQRTSVVAFRCSAMSRPSAVPANATASAGSMDSWNCPSDRAVQPGFPPSSGLRSSNWPAWSRSPSACTSPIGPARIWPAKRLTRNSPCHQRSNGPDDSGSGGPPAASHAVLEDISNRQPSSNNVPRRSSGATPTPRGWPGRASGWSVPMRSPTSKSWNDIRDGMRSPARSNSASSITRGTARSTSWSS